MRKVLAVLFALFFVTALAACGDDDDSAADGGSGSASGTEADAEEDEGGGASEEFCDQAENIAENSELEDLDFEDPDDVAVGVAILEDFQDAAPDEISDDLRVIIEAFEALVEAGDDPDALADLEEQFADVEERTTRVEDFVLEECGVDISDDSSDDGSDSGTDDSGLEAGEPDDPPSIDDPELEGLAEECFDGDGEACDQLFFQSDSGSPEEDYGNTCGGRFDESPGLCSTAIG